MDKSKEEDWINAYYKSRHQEQLSDPIYAAGFKSRRNKNPYTFDRELGYELLKLSMKKVLTNEDKALLVSLNQKIDKTPYSRWADGYFNKQRIKS